MVQHDSCCSELLHPLTGYLLRSFGNDTLRFEMALMRLNLRPQKYVCNQSGVMKIPSTAQLVTLTKYCERLAFRHVGNIKRASDFNHSFDCILGSQTYHKVLYEI